MEKKSVIPVWVSVILLLLCAAAVVLNIMGARMIRFGIYCSCFIFTSIAIILAILYCVSGYKKSSSSFFKTVAVSLLLNSFFGFILYYINPSKDFLLESICVLIDFGCFAVFAVATDIGKVKSIVLATIVVLTSIISLVHLLTMFSITIIGSNVASTILAVIFFIMVLAKYKDKDARGTK